MALYTCMQTTTVKHSPNPCPSKKDESGPVTRGAEASHRIPRYVSLGIILLHTTRMWLAVQTVGLFPKASSASIRDAPLAKLVANPHWSTRSTILLSAAYFTLTQTLSQSPRERLLLMRSFAILDTHLLTSFGKRC